MFAALFNFLWQIFLFLLGGVSALSALVYYINFYMSLGEEKTAQEYAKIVADSINEREKALSEKKDSSTNVRK